MHRVARVMDDVISRHFPALASPVVEPSMRTDDEHHTLALIVASSTLREQLGDQLDIRIAYQITATVVAAFLEAGGAR